MFKTYADRNFELRAMGFPTYKDYLASELWSSIQGRAWLELGDRCLICSQAAQHLHHVNYDRETLEGVTLSGLAPLCGGCHLKVEFTKRGQKRKLHQAQLAFRRMMRRRRGKLPPSVKPWQKSSRNCKKCGYRARKGTVYCRPCLAKDRADYFRNGGK